MARPFAPDAVYEATRHGWDRIWRASDVALEHETGAYARARATRARYAGLLPEGAIVEAGCGVGTELVAFESLGRRLHGLDYAPSALGALRRARPRASLTAGDVHRLPFRSGSLAGYLSFGVLEHFPFGPLPALEEAARALRPGGLLVATVPAPNPVWRAARLKRVLFGGAPPPYFETTYSARALARFAARAGFVEIETQPIDHAFALWGLGRPFRGARPYETSRLADMLGRAARAVAPRATAFATLLTGRKGGGG